MRALRVGCRTARNLGRRRADGHLFGGRRIALVLAASLAVAGVPTLLAAPPAATYVLTTAELTGLVYARVTATNAGGSTAATSSAVGPVTQQVAPQPPPAGDDPQLTPSEPPPQDDGGDDDAARPPGLVTHLTGRVRHHRLVVRWDPPRAGGSVVGYRYRVKAVVRGGTWGNWRSTSATSARVRLAAGARAYRVQVVARTSVETGPAATIRVNAPN